jgi:MATE family multidrug resistance protein
MYNKCSLSSALLNDVNVNQPNLVQSAQITAISSPSHRPLLFSLNHFVKPNPSNNPENPSYLAASIPQLKSLKRSTNLEVITQERKAHEKKETETGNMEIYIVRTAPTEHDGPAECDNTPSKILNISSFKMNRYERAFTILQRALPIFSNKLICILFETITLLFVGSYTNTLTLASVGLANMWWNTTGSILISGISIAISTLSKRHRDTASPQESRLLYHKGLILSWIMSTIVSVLNYDIESILLFLGQEAAVAHNVSQGMIFYSLNLYVYAFDCVTSAFLHAHKLKNIQNLATLITVCMHPIWCYIYLCHFNLGMIGAGLTYLTSSTLNGILLICIIKWIDMDKDIFQSFQKESFKNYKEVGMVSVHSIALLGIECWTLEVTTFLAGLLNQVQLAAHVSIYHLSCWVLLFEGSISTATLNLLAYYTKEGNKREFVETAKTAPILSAGLTLAAIGIVMFFRVELAQCFSNDYSVIVISYELLPFAMIFVFFVSIQKLLATIVKGKGRYKLYIAIKVCSYYFVGLLAGYLLAFKYERDLLGLWNGITIGIICAVVSYSISVYKLDFEKIEADMNERLSSIVTSYYTSLRTLNPAINATTNNHSPKKESFSHLVYF